MSKRCHTLTTSTTSTGLVRATLAAAERLGLSRAELLSDISVDGRRLEDKDARVPLQWIAELDEAIQGRLGAASAIQLAQLMERQHESLVAYLCRCSRTLREFFEQVCRYRALTMDVVTPTLSVRDGRAWFGCVYPQELVESLPVCIEKDLALWLARARRVLGRDWSPVEVHLQTPVTDTEQYRTFFRAPVRNGAAGCWLVFDAGLLDCPTLESDCTLLAYLQPIADGMLSQLHARHSFAGSVRDTMSKLMREGSCSIDDVAKALAMSARTVQRRLESEGTTFGEVFDETRRATALEYLRNPQIAIKEAAFRVGFSEPSTFYRAFRRWTGATPADYRRSLAI